MKKRFTLFFIFCVSVFILHGQDIFDAARKGDTVRIAYLIKINPDTVNSRNVSDFTPLILAAYHTQSKAVAFLLRYHANVNASSPEGPVILATCYKGNLALTELLISNGADVNAQNSLGTSALIYATQANNIELVTLLLKHGARKDLPEKTGRTALSIARESNSKAIITLLSGTN